MGGRGAIRALPLLWSEFMVIIVRKHAQPVEHKMTWHLPLVVRVLAPPPLIDPQVEAEIVHDVADRHGVHPNAIFGKSRLPHIVAARHAFVAEFMREYKLSLSYASKHLGWDRDMIRNALKKNLKREVERDLKLNGHI